jgi:hypothetical protein
MTEPEPKHEAEPPPATTIDTPPATNEPPRHDDAPSILKDGPSLHKEASRLPWLCAAGFAVLAGAIGFVWSHPWPVASPDAAALRGLQQQVQALQVRLEQLAERHPGGAADLQPLSERVAALEQRPAADLAPLEGRLLRLEQKTQDTQGLATRVDALAGRLDAMSGRDRGADAQLAQRLDADEARLSALEHDVGQASRAVQQATRLARIQAGAVALNAGQPLGDIPGAPAAVARFAAAAPPTEAALRLAFPAAARAALAASQPDTTGKPFLSRLLTRAEDLVTVRQGDRVLIGDSAAGVIARARIALDAGDLAGAVAAVSTLSGPAASAVATWRSDAQSLLDVRASLAAMAAHS